MLLLLLLMMMMMVLQLVNLGSSYKYDGGTEFICVVSRQCPSMQNGQCAEATDRGKVNSTVICLFVSK